MASEYLGVRKMSHNVSLENTFSGPMDLLLYLVRRDEIDIHDIPVAHLTREYLAEIEKMDLVDVDAGGEFVAMASMLTEMKSRMLLPAVEAGEEGEEEEENFDPRQGLVQALLEYKRFKEVAAELEVLAELQLNRFGRMAPPPEFAARVEIEAQELGALDLFAAFQRLASKLLSANAPREIINEEVSTEVRIEQIEHVLTVRDRVDFTSLLSDHPTKDEMVGFFIALLELIRLKKVRAQQSVDFSEIYFFKYSPEQAEQERKLIEAEQAPAREAATRPAGDFVAPAGGMPRREPMGLAALFGKRKQKEGGRSGIRRDSPLPFLQLHAFPIRGKATVSCYWGFPFVRATLQPRQRLSVALLRPVAPNRPDPVAQDVEPIQVKPVGSGCPVKPGMQISCGRLKAPMRLLLAQIFPTGGGARKPKSAPSRDFLGGRRNRVLVKFPDHFPKGFPYVRGVVSANRAHTSGAVSVPTIPVAPAAFTQDARPQFVERPAQKVTPPMIRRPVVFFPVKATCITVNKQGLAVFPAPKRPLRTSDKRISSGACFLPLRKR